MTYSLIEVFNEIVKEFFTPYFKSKGFKKQHLNFYKVENGVTFMVNFQKNAYNSADYVAFYVNCGIYSADVMQTIGAPVLTHPKEYECLFNKRFESITGSEKREFELLISGDDAKKALANDVIMELEKVVAFYDSVKSHDDLLDVCVEEGTHFWRELFTYLAIKKDKKRLDKYAAFFGNIFKGDERRPWFENEINAILKAHHLESIKFEAE
jgi:hypothetical protein